MSENRFDSFKREEIDPKVWNHPGILKGKEWSKAVLNAFSPQSFRCAVCKTPARIEKKGDLTLHFKPCECGDFRPEEIPGEIDLEKPTLNSEIYNRFADYYRRNSTWGVFHVALEDYGYDFSPSELREQDFTEEERELITIFDSLTYSQRKKLGRKAEEIVNGKYEQ